MKSKFLLFALSVLLITGCSSSNQASKTPDDVYYSPARAIPVPPPPPNTYKDEYDEYISSSDDRYLQMKVQNRDLWSTLDDYNYWNDPTYTLNYGYYYGSPYFNNYLYSGYYNPYNSIYGLGYFNPFYTPAYGGYSYGAGYAYHGGGYYPPAMVVTRNPLERIPVARPALSTYGRPRTYNGDPYNSHNSPYTNYNNTNNRVTNNPAPAPVRTYSPPSGSSGGGGGGVSRPGRRG